MAAPVVASTATAAGFGSSVTSTLPSGVSAGDLLLLANARSTATTTTWPGTWTPILTNSVNGSAFEVGYRFHQAGDSAPALTMGASVTWANRMLRVTGAHATTPPEATTMATGSSTTPDPGSLDPTGWGTEDTLWLAICSYGTASDPSAYPSSYGDGLAIRFSSLQPTLATATRALTAASEDPGTFTLPASAAWRAATIGIRPAAGAPPPDTAKFLAFFT